MNKLSVVIPVYNEEVNIRKGVIEKIYNYLEKQKYKYEVILIDDGSKDKTVNLLTKEVSSKQKFKLVLDKHTGKAFTLLKGLEHTTGDIVLFMDFDQATPISEFSKLLPHFSNGYSVVIGSRGSKRKNAPFHRKLLSKSQVILRHLILGMGNIKDTQCGFKAYKSEAILSIAEKLYMFNPKKANEIKKPAVAAGFDVEVLYVAKLQGFKIKEVPVTWDYKMSRRVNLFNDALKGVKELIVLRYLSIKGLYNN